jgi:hypothetical protein
LISEQVVSSPVGSVGWTGLNSSQYSEFLLYFDFTPTASLQPILRFNGLSGATDYVWGLRHHRGTTTHYSAGSLGDTSIIMTHIARTARISGRVSIDPKVSVADFSNIGVDGYISSGVGRLITPAATGTLALLASTSTIASGTFRLYGVV